MQTIVINGTAVIRNNNQSVTTTLNSTLNVSGSNQSSPTLTFATNTWVTCSQATNKDFRMGIFTNNDPSSSVFLAVGNTGSYQILSPGDTSIVNYSGSTTIWAFGTGSHSPVTLNTSIFGAL